MNNPASPTTALREVIEGPLGAHIPDARDALSSLAEELDRVVESGLKPDRKLLTIDLWNAVNAAESVADARAAGRSSEFLEEAMGDLLLLVADMRARARSALGEEDARIALHAKVAARDAAAPQDLTPQFRTVVAAPAALTDDAPGSLADAPVGVSERDYGRVSGEVILIEREAPSSAAPQDCVVLPASSFVQFEPGESFEVFTDGHAIGGQFDAPQRGERRRLIIEAGSGGCALYGPAVLRLTGEPRGHLTEMREDLEAVNAAWDTRRKEAYGDGPPVFQGLILIWFMAGMGAVIYPSMPVIGAVVLTLAAAGTAGAVAWWGRDHGRKVLLRRDIRRREDAKMPPRVLSGEFSRRFLRMTGYRGWEREHLVPTSEGLISVAHSMDAVKDFVPRISGLNIFPMRQISVRRGQEPRVMEPLLAIAGPDPLDAPVKRKVVA